MSPGICDVVVVGAGAAGMMAAIRAADRGRRTLLLEKNKKPGVKILMSGGTRCNITHDTDNRGIVEAYGQPGKFLHSALAAFSVQDTLDFFHAEGVATKVEETGKIFPVSNRATDVLAALVRRLERSGANLSTAEAVTDLEVTDNGFLVKTIIRIIGARCVILTSGGQSYPGSGTTGDGYHFARKLGHTIVPPRPALVPITTDEAWVRDLRGVTLPDISVRLQDGNKMLAIHRGSLLFAHFGLSGPVILDLSRHVSGHPEPNRLTLCIDLVPSLNEDQLSQILQEACSQSGRKLLAVVLSQFIPRRLAEIILTLCGLPPNRTSAALRREDRRCIVQCLKALTIPVRGTLGFEKAEVTAGGVALSEVDSRTMESKIIKNLYLAGEILDLDGPIGGFNFQAAWSMGWLAGSSV